MLQQFVLNSTSNITPSVENWHELEYVLARNSLLPLFYSLINPTSIPSDFKKRWQLLAVKTHLLNERAEAATHRLSVQLAEANIPMVVLRGMSLLQHIYPQKMMRPMVDVDILIRKKDKDLIENILASNHWTPVKRLRSQLVYSINETKFELHWSLLTPKRYRNFYEFDNWLGNNEFLQCKNNFPTLRPEEELIELILHAFVHHEIDTILKLTDCALLIGKTKINWEHIYQWASENKMERIICLYLCLIDKFFAQNTITYFPGYTRYLSKFHRNLTQAYMNKLMQQDSLADFAWRKYALIFVARDWKLKIKQCIRFISLDTIMECWQILPRPNSNSVVKKYSFQSPDS